MRKKTKNKITFIFTISFLVLWVLPLSAQHLKSMDFRNQKITDILMVLAEATETSIIPDETVEGSASFHFTDSDLEPALQQFLQMYKLHYTRTGSVFRISRIALSQVPETGLVTIQADSVQIELLVRALSREVRKTILYDPIPGQTVTVDINNLPTDAVLEILTRKLPGYTVEVHDNYFYIRRTPENHNTEGKNGNIGSVTREGENYALSVKHGRFLDIIAELFKKAGKEYSLLTHTDIQLENLYFSGRVFDNLLRLILEQGNADFVIKNGIYYILELQRKDILKNLTQTHILPLKYLSAVNLPNLLPADLSSGNIVKTDKTTNTAFLTGTEEEIRPIENFITRIDRPLNGLTYERFDLKYLKVRDLMSIIPQELTPVPPVAIPDSNAFIELGTPEVLAILEKFLQKVDQQQEGYPVYLRYLKTQELLKSLPPAISKEDITDSGFPNLVFFTGSEDKRKLFLSELATIDRPKPQIRYELLVIQYLKSNEMDMSRTLSFTSSPDKDKTVVTGNLSNLLSLNFDVVSQFGYQFAANLSLQIGENLAQVYADTTLNGLSGQDIKFQNTDTYRYQELEVDDDTGKVTDTGVTREITSGLIVTLNGWVSGDNMITINVNATVSKQNSNQSTSTTTLPSTSERIVTTQVRTPSGKPIVISGLLKDDVNTNIQKIPILGDIPLLGWIFRNEKKSHEKTEIVIYIVPHLSREEISETDDSLRVEQYYHSFVKENEQ